MPETILSGVKMQIDGCVVALRCVDMHFDTTYRVNELHALWAFKHLERIMLMLSFKDAAPTHYAVYIVAIRRQRSHKRAAYKFAAKALSCNTVFVNVCNLRHPDKKSLLYRTMHFILMLSRVHIRVTNICLNKFLAD